MATRSFDDPASDGYHSARCDVIVGLITGPVAGSTGSTDQASADWSAAGLRLPSLFRSFFVAVPRTAVYHFAGHVYDQDWLAVRVRGSGDTMRCKHDVSTDMAIESPMHLLPWAIRQTAFFPSGTK